MKATKEQDSLFTELFNAILKEHIAIITSGEASASEMANAMKFLKDNNICIDSTNANDNPLVDLLSSMGKLPFQNLGQANMIGVEFSKKEVIDMIDGDE